MRIFECYRTSSSVLSYPWKLNLSTQSRFDDSPRVPSPKKITQALFKHYSTWVASQGVNYLKSWHDMKEP